MKTTTNHQFVISRLRNKADWYYCSAIAWNSGYGAHWHFSKNYIDYRLLFEHIPIEDFHVHRRDTAWIMANTEHIFDLEKEEWVSILEKNKSESEKEAESWLKVLRHEIP